MNDVLSRRIERIHGLGILATASLIGSVISMLVCPEVTWTRLMPVLKPTPIDHCYSLEDVRHWTEARALLPTRQDKLRRLRNELSAETVALEDWVLKVPADASARKKVLRSVGESFHEQATRFGLYVELIRIENDETTSAKSLAEFDLRWYPMTLRLEGTYVQACRFLHHAAAHLPTQCRHLRWTRIPAGGEHDARRHDTSSEPRFELEIVIAVAIIVDEPSVEEEPARADTA